MPKIINPFRGTDPIAQTLSQLGQTMFGDQTGAAKRKEDLYAAQRTNAETDNLVGLIGQKGSFGSFKSPIGQAMAFAAGMKGGDMGDYALADAGLNFGAADQRTQNAQVASGQSYDNTADAFGAKLAEVARNNDMQSGDRRYGVDQSVGQQRYEFDNKPLPALDATGAPAFTTQGAFDGFSPILSNAETQGTLARQNFGSMGDLPPAEQNYLGANGAGGEGSIFNYITQDGKTYLTRDGVTDAQTGQALPPGGYKGTVQGTAADVGLTNSVTSGVQGNIISADKFLSTADAMIGLTQNPSNFGPVGLAKSLGQEAGQSASALVQLFGGNDVVNKEVDQARQELMSSGLGQLIPELYDPALPAIDILGGLMVYQGAAALAGQEGRGVSDKDVQFWRQMLGDPKGLFESAQSIKTKMEIAKAVVENHKALAQQYLKSGVTPLPDDGALSNQALSQAIQQIAGQPGDPNLPAPTMAAAPTAIQPGTIEDGWRFNGGDPADQNNWTQVQ